MKYLIPTFAMMFIAARCYCGEWLPLPEGVSWGTLTNTDNFREFYSTTNIPSEVISYILSLPIGPHGSRMAEPGEGLDGSRLVWAATDGDDYIVHYEVVANYGLTNYCVSAAHHSSKNGTWNCSNGGFFRRFKDYKDFIDYYRHITSNP